MKEVKDFKGKVSEAQKKKKIAEAIKLLNDIVQIKVAPSSIHGVGVFAMRDLNKNVKLYADAMPQFLDIPYKEFKKLRPEVAEYILGRWPLITKGSHFIYPDTKFSSFLNHSFDPNYDAKSDKTLRKIKAGEEITEDYTKIEGYEQVYPFLDKTK